MDAMHIGGYYVDSPFNGNIQIGNVAFGVL